MPGTTLAAVGRSARRRRPRPRKNERPIGTALGLLAVCLLIFATGVFVAAEFALVAADRNRLDAAAEAGSRRAHMARALLTRLSFHLSGAQLGITVTSLVLGILAEPIVAHLLEPLFHPLGEASLVVSVVVALLLVTYLEMVIGELVPKTLAIADPQRTTLLLAPFLRLYGLVFGPFITVLNHAANWVVRKLGIEPREELLSVRSLSELALLAQVSAQEGALANTASELITRSVRFAEKTAADVLIPRVEVQAVARDATVSELVALAVDTGLSRIPVYGADLDDIVGLVLVKRVHELPVTERAHTPVAALMDEIVAVPETRDLESILVEMRDRRVHLMAVIDEYGGTAGIVTLEDLLEEIVGHIEDEYDPFEPLPAQRLRSGSFVVAGNLHPDEVLDATGFAVPEGEYETLAGFVLDRLGHVPEPGERFTHAGWDLVVEEMDRRRVARVRLTAVSPDAAADATGSSAPGPIERRPEPEGEELR